MCMMGTTQHGGTHAPPCPLQVLRRVGECTLQQARMRTCVLGERNKRMEWDMKIIINLPGKEAMNGDRLRKGERERESVCRTMGEGGEGETRTVLDASFHPMMTHYPKGITLPSWHLLHALHEHGEKDIYVPCADRPRGHCAS